jgi:lon-related putative ATP-dependent protease
MMAESPQEVGVAQARRRCDPATLGFTSTEELPSLEESIGQDRALHALEFGIDIRAHGYHLFALGPTGTGKATIIQKHLVRDAKLRPIPDDWLYVNNFANPDKPRAIRLPAGQGCALRRDMERLVQELKNEVPRAFESADYLKNQEQLGGEFQKQREALFDRLEAAAAEKGFRLMQTPQGLLLAPVMGGLVLNPEQLHQLDESTRRELSAREEALQREVRETMRAIQQLQKEAQTRVSELDRQVVALAVGHLLDDLKDRYSAFPAVTDYLDLMRDDLLENVRPLKQLRQLEQMQADAPPWMGVQAPTFDQYQVNLLVDNCANGGAPVIQARNPSYQNLIGRIEHQGQFGVLVTNFRMIKAGLLHRANGGYLMLDLREVLTKPLAWEGLKRALKNRVVELESLMEAYGAFTTHTLDPEPIPLDIKVVLLGDPMLYYLLYAFDPDFQELFKVKVDFAARMPWQEDGVHQYARFLATVCREEQLRHFDAAGVARVIEHGARLVAHQRHLVIRFGEIVDLMRQADYWAGKAGRDRVTADDVERAIREHVYRSNQIEELLREAIADGTLRVETDGVCVGQINGIAVLGVSEYMFGKPARITARTYVGTSGVINIDREAKLGGRLHNKGVFILSGFLGGKYAAEAPLAIAASLTFEQLYEEVEGDSAASTELYALLSSLADLPIRQELAVTGSVDQHGGVQAIGGVNEKIEGFFDVCRLHGLTGRQGVLIPASNVQHLMLREDVVDAIGAGQFHIYPVTTIDEGISLLTGVPAGDPSPEGTYPPDTVNGRVQRRLHELAQRVKAFVQPDAQRTHPEENEEEGV